MANYSPPSYSTILQSAINNYTQMSNYLGLGVQITPTDATYITLSTFASLMAVMYQYENQLTNSKLIDTATGSDLDRIGNFLGFVRRTSLSSQGAVVLIASAAQTLLAGSLLTAPNGLTFQVQSNGVYNNGQNVNIVSVSTGSSTNLDVGSIMSWQTPSGTMQTTALVSVACTGGVDAEDDETFRNRIYLSVQSPPGMGNATQVITTASSVDNIVQQAFTYANFNGAGTQLIALTGYQTNSYIGRDIPHLQYDGYVSIYGTTVFNPSLIKQIGGFGAYNQYTLAANNLGPNLSNDSSAIYGQMPVTIANPFATVITTVNNVPSDVAAVITLPYPVGASPNGLGGGWLNATPWPVPDGFYVENFCQITNITNSTTITVSAPSSGTTNTGNPNTSFLAYNGQVPTQGQTKIQWVNRSDANQIGWNVVTATILTAVDNANQTWTLTLDTPLVFAPGTEDFYGNTGVQVGDYVFPAAANAQTYVNNILAGYALLGPGEVTSDQGLLSLGAARYPSSTTQFSNILGENVEKLLESNSEVFNAELNPGQGTTLPNGNIVFNCYNTASVSPANNAPPNIYVPRQLGFYPYEKWNFGT